MGIVNGDSGSPRGSLMRGLRWISYKVRLLLLGLFGPARLDDEHDPIVQLKKEHGESAGDVGRRS